MTSARTEATLERSYTILLWPEPEGGYTVTCPTLPGLTTYGETLAEARLMASEAIEAYLESLRKDGEPLPDSDPPAAPPISDRVSVRVPSGPQNTVGVSTEKGRG